MHEPFSLQTMVECGECTRTFWCVERCALHPPFPTYRRCLTNALVFPETSLTSFRHDKILHIMTLYFSPACLSSVTTPSPTTSPCS